MNKALISLVFVLLFFVGSCGCPDDFPYSIGDACWSEKAPGTYCGSSSYDVFSHKESAVAYCAGLGGDLPSLSDLRSLVVGCPFTVSGGACRVSDSCNSWDCLGASCDGCAYSSQGYSVFGDTGIFWSSLPVAEYSAASWFVNFNTGRVGDGPSINEFFVRCVYY